MRSWVGEALAGAPLELSVVGDFEVERAISLAARYFGSLDRRLSGEGTGMAHGPVFPEGGELRIEVETEIPSALVIVAYPTDDMWNIGQTRRLAVLADLFSERMRVDIREKPGASYSPFAFNRSSRAYEGFGYMAAMVESDPQKVDTVVAAVRKIASDLAENGVSQEEVHRVLEPTLNRIRDMRARNGYWLSTVLTGAWEHPLQIAWSRSIEDDYAAIDSTDANTLARLFLVDAKAAVIVVTPAPKN